MAQVALQAALERLGFSPTAAVYLVYQQSMDTLEEFSVLTDGEVENLCQNVRRPGGTILNPNANVQGQPAEIPNPGISVTLRATNNLKLMCYFLRFRERTSRPVTADDITLDSVRALRELKAWEESHVDDPAPELTFKDWPRTVEVIEEYLRGCLGTTKLPLAYVIREDVDVPDSATDPSTNYATHGAELIARAPHVAGVPPTYTATYLADREKVYTKIADLTRDHECWTYVRPAQKSRDGRAAFLGLKDHYLGESNVDNMASKAEAKLQQSAYHGETRRWNFEKYVRLHVDQHAILEGLKDQGYSGIDNRSKVRLLLAGIKTKEFDSVRTQILSTPSLRKDFAACVNLYQDFISQSSSNNPRTSNVSSVGRSNKKSNGDDDGVEPDMSVEDRYYTIKEYKALSAAKKKGLRLKRGKREGKDGKGGKSDKKAGNKRKPNLSKREIKALKRLAKSKGKSDTTEEENESDASDDEEVPMKPPSNSNRNNKALQRKGKGKSD